MKQDFVGESILVYDLSSPIVTAQLSTNQGKAPSKFSHIELLTFRDESNRNTLKYQIFEQVILPKTESTNY